MARTTENFYKHITLKHEISAARKGNFNRRAANYIKGKL